MKELDNIELLIDNMRRQSHAMEYEDAQYILDKIKEELLRKEENDNFLEIFHVKTIKDIYNLVTSHSIRLNMDDYDFAKFLDLLISLKDRKNELQGGRYIDIYRQRKIVAEEMSKLEIPIQCKWKGIKPNRAFLDITFKINPSLCRTELIRREKVNMWKSIKSGKEFEKKEIRKRLINYRDYDIQ